MSWAEHEPARMAMPRGNADPLLVEDPIDEDGAFFELWRGFPGSLVRSPLAEIVCHEPGDADHRGAADVLALIKKVSEIPLALGAARVLVTYEHAAARTRWWAERADTRVEGNEVAVSRFAGDKIAEVWLWYDGYDQAATTSSSRSTSARPSSSAVPDS
jgi:hypothetical protein